VAMVAKWLKQPMTYRAKRYAHSTCRYVATLLIMLFMFSSDLLHLLRAGYSAPGVCAQNGREIEFVESKV